jgi:hypothetical protein
MHHDARDKQASPVTGLRAAVLRIAITDSPKARVDVVDIESIRLIPDDGAGSVQLVGRLRFDRTAGAYEELALPRHFQDGEFEAIEVAWSLPKRPSARGAETTRTIRQRLNIELGRTEALTPHIRLATSADKLLDGSRDAFSAELVQPDEDAIHISPQAGGSELLLQSRLGTDRQSAFRVRLPGNAFGSDGVVQLTEHDPTALPPLFDRQHVVGSALRLQANVTPAMPIDIDLPFDPVRVAGLGVAPEALVVLALDEAKSVYRELVPVRIDRGNHMLTVRTTRLSYFFPGTPGITLHRPAIAANALGEIVGYSNGDTLGVLGRVTDDRAAVDVQGAAGGWSQSGWFGFGGIPLDLRGDTHVLLRAQVPNRLPHERTVIIRRVPPPRLLPDGARVGALRLGVDRNNVAVVSQLEHVTSDLPLLEALNNRPEVVSHHAVFAYYPARSGDRTEWFRIQLSDSLDLLNEIAASVIEQFNALELDTPRIAWDPANPEGRSALEALRAHAPGVERENGVLALGMIIFLLRSQAIPQFASQLAYSPVAPLQPASDEGSFHCAYVQATNSGVKLAGGGWMATQLRNLYAYYSPMRNADTEVVEEVRVAPASVAAGALVYVRLDHRNNTVAERMVVADDIWCTAVALRVDPSTHQPVILAIGAVAEMNGRAPTSRLLLFRRNNEGAWSESLVDDTRAYVVADLALESSGRARIIASFAETTSPVDCLVEINEARDGWQIRSFFWSTNAGTPAVCSGSCPCIAIDSSQGRNASVVGFIYNVGGLPRYILGRRRGAAWSFQEIATFNTSDIWGAPLLETAGQEQNRIVMASGHSNFHFAPSIELLGPGSVGYGYCDGTFHVARVHLDTGEVGDRVVDVDRLVGAGHALARRPSGSVAAVYKDFWGGGVSGATGTTDQTRFFSSDNYAYNPGQSQDVGSPFFRRRIISFETLTQKRRFSFRELVDRDVPDDEKVRSILFNHPLDLRLFPQGFSPLPWNFFAYWYTHNRIADMVWRLQSKPAITQLTIRSEDAADDIRRIDFLITGVLLQITNSVRVIVDALNAARFPAELVSAFLAAGLNFNRFSLPAVTPVRPDPQGRAREWDIRAENPFEETASTDVPLDIHYFATLAADGNIDIRMRPIISVLPRSFGIDRYAVIARYAPFERDQRAWDEFGGMIGGALSDNLNFAIPQDAGPGRIANMAITGVHLSRYAAVASAGDQQGALRFEYTIDSMVAGGSVNPPVLERVGFVASSAGATTITMEFFPFVSRDGLVWARRLVQVRQPEFDVDIDIGLAKKVLLAFVLSSALKLVVGELGMYAGAAAPVIGPLIAEGIISGDVSETELLGPGETDDIAGFVAEQIQARTRSLVEDSLFSNMRAFESCYLSGFTLELVQRQELVIDDGIDILPRGISFGETRPGDARIVRNVIVFNNSNEPAVITDFQLADETLGFQVTSAAAMPIVLQPGTDFIVRIEFTPGLPFGERMTHLTVANQFGGTTTAGLFAVVGGAPPMGEPRIQVLPSAVHFGYVRGQSERRLRIRNIGSDILTLTRFAISTDDNSAPAFVTPQQSPVSVDPNDRISVTNTYVPSSGDSKPERATMLIDSNDPQTPQVAVRLTAIMT